MTEMIEMIETTLGRLTVTVRPGPANLPPLVLGHGIFLDSTIWDEVLAGPLAPNRVVVTIDGPGHGGSDPAPKGWSLGDHAAAVIDVLDALGMTDAVLVGHSWGGMVSLRAACAHPDRVAGVGLINTPLVATQSVHRLAFRAQQMILRTLGPSAFFGDRAARALYDPVSLKDRPELARRLTRRIEGRSGRVLADVLRAVVLDPPSALDDLRLLRMPVAVVAGENDYVLNPAIRARIAQTAPAVTVTTLAGGHISPEEDPAGLADALRRLLDDVDRCAA